MRHNSDNMAIEVCGVILGQERYVLIYRADLAEDAIDAACDWAGNPDLAFGIQDAIFVSERIRAGKFDNVPGL